MVGLGGEVKVRAGNILTTFSLFLPFGPPYNSLLWHRRQKKRGKVEFLVGFVVSLGSLFPVNSRGPPILKEAGNMFFWLPPVPPERRQESRNLFDKR